MKQCPFCLGWMEQHEKQCPDCDAWVTPHRPDREAASPLGEAFTEERKGWQAAPLLLQAIGLLLLLLGLCVAVPRLWESYCPAFPFLRP